MHVDASNVPTENTSQYQELNYNGVAPASGSTPQERLIERKSHRWKEFMKHRTKHWDWRRDTRRRTQDYVWHRDAPTQVEMDQCALRQKLLQMALLASTQVELEDLRSPEEVEADAATMKPHDPKDGPANMDTEVEKDKLSLAGKLDPSGYTVVTAPSVAWYDKDFIEQHPTWLFVYADMAADGKDSNCIAKDDSRFASGTPLAKVCRPLANTLPYAVCTSDGKALDDSSLKQNRLRLSDWPGTTCR